MTETAEDEDMPGVEFEGPLGQFWLMEEVPTAALIKGKLEIEAELKRRGVIKISLSASARPEGGIVG